MASVYGIAIGSDGTTILAVAPSHRPRLSLNAGVSWADITYFSASGNYVACAVCEDNQTMLVADPTSGTLYMSLNGGTDWEVVPGPVSGDWPGVCGVGIASDSLTMVLCCYGGRCYKTGSRWSSYTEIRPLGDVNASWHCIAVSANGSIIITGIFEGRLYLSKDGGETDNWPETQPAGDDDQNWTSLAVGADNATLLAGDSLGFGTLYRSSDEGDNWYVETVDPAYEGFSAVALGGEALYAVAACDEGFGDSHVYLGAYTESPPPGPGPTPDPSDFPVIDKLRVDAYYAELDVDEVEILGLPISSDFIDVNS